jgi:LysM repeat protein
MALPSQYERSSELSRPYSSRSGGLGTASAAPVRRPRKNTLILAAIAGLMALAVVAIYGIGRLRSGTTSAPPAAMQVAGLGTDVTNPSTPANSGTKNPATQPTTAPLTIPATAPSSQAPFTPNTTGSAQPATFNATPGSTPPGTTPGTNSTPKPAPFDATNPSTTTANPQPPTTPTTTAPAAAPGILPSIPNPTSASEFRAFMDAGDKALSANKPVEARRQYSRALLSKDATRSDQESLRAKLTGINDDLVFSSRITTDDPFVEGYTVAPADKLVNIVKKRQLAVDWHLIQRINKIDPSKIKVGQKLKLVRGPFHAIVHKADYRADIFAGSPDDPENWVFIRSFRVGLGENDSTPLGNFIVKRANKAANPPWTNPRTGEHFDGTDPKNPIGKFWIGLEGLGSSSAATGYGLHGTIEPDSIGQQKSMGCIRMGNEDIALTYELLVEQVSVVKIVP